MFFLSGRWDICCDGTVFVIAVNCTEDLVEDYLSVTNTLDSSYGGSGFKIRLGLPGFETVFTFWRMCVTYVSRV